MAVVELSHPALPVPRVGTAWLRILIAAGAMVATLPGRTYGLGLITEPLLAALHIDRVNFAAVNLWATLLGAAFCLPCGGWLDRLGTPVVLAGVGLGLGLSVLGLCSLDAAWGPWLVPALFLLLLLTRGLGQSALSVVSLALMGKAAGAGGLRVAVYSIAVALGFAAAVGAIKFVSETWQPDWRVLWGGLGIAVAAFALIGAVLAAGGVPVPARTEATGATGATLGQALRTPAFWVFALATSLYGMIAAGISLFNQSILAERHFDRRVFMTVATVTPLVGLAANLVTGWLANWIAPGRLLAAAMLLLAGALLAFPFVQTLEQVYVYAVVLGVAGGMITVLFFGAWGRLYGTAHLGHIQGAAQLLTVLASALGPLLLAATERAAGSYTPAFQGVALVAIGLALAAWFLPSPAPEVNAR